MIDGRRWRAYKVTENAIDIARNKLDFPDTEWFEKANIRDFALNGRVVVHPLFIKQYAIFYASFDDNSGHLKTFKYHEPI